MSVDIVKLEKKLTKAVGDEVVSAIKSENAAELEQRLVRLAKHENETLTRQKDDEEIQRLSEELKVAKGPYKDALKGIKLQRRYVAICLSTMGSPVSGNQEDS